MSFGFQVLGFGGYPNRGVFTEATGGTVTTDGNFKVHTFTSSGTFSIGQVGDDDIHHLVIAGGGGAGGSRSSGANGTGAGGAGGYRTSFGTSGANSSAESVLAFSSSGAYQKFRGGRVQVISS